MNSPAQFWRSARRYWRRGMRLAILYILSFLVALICLLPIMWMIKSRLRPQNPCVAPNPVLAAPTHLDNYRSVLSNPNARIGRSTFNSIMWRLVQRY
jgi:ABC-type glycerol-3-phosphate transport system permease component